MIRHRTAKATTRTSKATRKVSRPAVGQGRESMAAMQLITRPQILRAASDADAVQRRRQQRRGRGLSPLSSAGGGLSSLKPPELGGIGGMSGGMPQGLSPAWWGGDDVRRRFRPRRPHRSTQGLNAGLGGAPAAPLAPPVTSAASDVECGPCGCGLIRARVCRGGGRVAYVFAGADTVCGSYRRRARDGCGPGGSVAAVRLGCAFGAGQWWRRGDSHIRVRAGDGER